MSMQDTIADMIVRLKNAQSAKKVMVSMPGSKIKENIAKILLEEGYITSFNMEDRDNNKKLLNVELKYFQGQPVIQNMKRVSKSSLRVYKKRKDLPRVKGGLGVALVSTPKGLMTDQKARAIGHGGEIICIVS